MPMLCQILFSAKRAEAALGGGYALSVEAMTSKIILMIPKNQELSKFQRIESQKASRIKIQEQSSFKIQSSFKN